MFPLLISNTPERVGPAHTATAVGLQVSAAVLGQSLVPGSIGVLAHAWGLEVIGAGILFSGITAFALFEALGRLAAPDAARAERMNMQS